MEAASPGPQADPIERRTLRWLMNGVERLLAIFDREGVAAWLDWGTLLGAERHRNIIPWDYDGDFCLLQPDYERVLDVFARRGGTIDGLTLRPDFFGEAGSCCAVVPADAPNPEHGLDLVAYRRVGGRLRHLMSDALVAEFPGDYDFPSADLFPLRRAWLLGRRAWVPHHVEERLVTCYGPGWQSFPDGRSASALTTPPLRELPDVPASDAVQAAPAIVRAARPVPAATGYRRAEELCDARAGAWRKDGPGIDLVRVVDADALERAGQEAISAFAGGTFTEAVWAADRALWGSLWVGALAPGDTLVVPPGTRVVALPEAG